MMAAPPGVLPVEATISLAPWGVTTPLKGPPRPGGSHHSLLPSPTKGPTCSLSLARRAAGRSSTLRCRCPPAPCPCPRTSTTTLYRSPQPGAGASEMARPSQILPREKHISQGTKIRKLRSVQDGQSLPEARFLWIAPLPWLLGMAAPIRHHNSWLGC